MQPFGATMECFDGLASPSCMPKMSDTERIKCHPLMPILELKNQIIQLLCKKCGDATHTMQPMAFQMNDVCQLFRKLDSKGVSTRTNNEKLDKFMKDAIIVLRTHLSELQKVASLTEDFHTKYLSEYFLHVIRRHM
ncbi:unnamed protein product [Angiostrongylus costaricensis]|uniref:Meis_PKNOX_N domain-containing protein n=1 Tax=Angiostrongylus costaricensis TaxID=334426 RepID=A0A0R3PGM2_ANGCS|nr:unnamed protein product [Angiostrongylus costaricensis]